MKRRDFIALAGAAALPTPAFARVPPTALTAFQSSFADPVEALGPTRVRFDRSLPPALSGTLFRNGPARMQRGAMRYLHWFDGDGMIQSYRLSGNEMVHQARMVRTSRYVAEEKAGRFLWGGFGTGFPSARAVRRPDDVNVANISVLPLERELLALWEGGSAWRVDPLSLDTLGRKVFSPETDGLPFSAHPRTDPDGRIWSFGYAAGSGKLVLYDIEASGRLNRVELINAPNADMVHDFAITERYLVFVLMPVSADLDAAPDEGIVRQGFLRRLRWEDERPVIVLLVDKSTLTVAHRFELVPFFAFHFGNAWEDGGAVRIEVAQAPPFDISMRTIENATVGTPLGAPHDCHPAMDIVLDPLRGRARTQALPRACAEFPRFDQRYTGLKTTRLIALIRAPSMPDEVFGYNAVVTIDRIGGRTQSFDYGEFSIAEEHVFVPGPGAREGAGWLIGTVYDWHAGRTELTVLDAGAVADGPIARAPLPYALPLGLHGQFVPS